MSTVTHLLIKRSKEQAMLRVDRLNFSLAGITGNVPTMPLRQVLLLPGSTLREFNLQPGDLRENIVMDRDDLHTFDSGTLLQVGPVQIRLTFHCEPCGRVADKASPKALTHKRGYLGQVVNAGTVTEGDPVNSLGVHYEPVPYSARDRVEWFLARQAQPVLVTDMLYECGLPVGYARAVPGYLKSMPDAAEKVIFQSHGKNTQQSTLWEVSQ